MKKLLAVFVVLAVIGVGWRVYSINKSPEQKNSSDGQNQQTNQNTEQQKTSGFDKTKYSLTEPTSIWVVVNKKNALPSNYKPADLVVPDVKLRLGAGAEQMHLRKEVNVALKEMFAAAKADGLELMLGSGFRSYATQKSFYDSYLAKDGVAGADRYSARPGHSEHQSGLALDIDKSDQKCHLQTCFGDLPEGKWLAAHAYKYGFILRYTADKEAVTGYQYEPWHFRYVGKELSEEMHRTGITTLEEFFNLPAAPTY